VNGVPVVSALDLAREAGAFTALERTVRVTVVGGEGVVVALAASAGTTTVSGIAVRRRP
jgi:hypothetical protein